MSGTVKMRSSISISAMVCSASILSQYLLQERRGQTGRHQHNVRHKPTFVRLVTANCSFQTALWESGQQDEDFSLSATDCYTCNQVSNYFSEFLMKIHPRLYKPI